jgi:hypothetical protein
VKSEQLLTQGKIFEDDILAGPECTNNPAEEVPEPYDHAQNLTGTLPIELGAKSLILRVYDVLMNDRHEQQTRTSDSGHGVLGVWLPFCGAGGFETYGGGILVVVEGGAAIPGVSGSQRGASPDWLSMLVLAEA